MKRQKEGYHESRAPNGLKDDLSYQTNKKNETSKADNKERFELNGVRESVCAYVQ
jgi:hypothetical protein